MGLTLSVVRHMGVAFGLWGYRIDLALNGTGQGKNPDLIAVEESDIYAAVMDAIEAQAPRSGARREVAGRTVWWEEEPSELYIALREAMFEAYRWAPYLPQVPRYGVDRITPPSSADPSWTFSANPDLESPELVSALGALSFVDMLVAEGMVQGDQVRPPATRTRELRLAFTSKEQVSTFLKCLNRWLFDHAVAVAKRRWDAAGAARS
jgi:hypothetical protein